MYVLLCYRGSRLFLPPPTKLVLLPPPVRIKYNTSVYPGSCFVRKTRKCCFSFFRRREFVAVLLLVRYYRVVLIVALD